MIFLGETNDPSREMAFHLPDATNPLNPVLAHTFVTGEVKIRLPGGAYANADVTRVVEKGFGDYALQLTDAQVATKGKVYLYVNVPGAQLWSSDEEIVYKVDLAGAVGTTLPPSGAFTWQSLIDRARVYIADDSIDEPDFIKPNMWMLYSQIEYNNARRDWIRKGVIKPALTTTTFTGPSTALTGVAAIAGVAQDMGTGSYPRWLEYTETQWPSPTSTPAETWQATGFATQQTVTIDPPDAGNSYIVKWVPAIGYVTDPTLTVDLPPGMDERIVLGMAKRANVKSSTRSGAIDELIREQDAQLAFGTMAAVRNDGPRAHRSYPWASHRMPPYNPLLNPLRWRWF